MIVNGWTQEIDRLKAENRQLRDDRQRRIMEVIFVFVGVPVYAVSLWMILEWCNR
jgi:hypothetical protein